MRYRGFPGITSCWCWTHLAFCKSLSEENEGDEKRCSQYLRFERLHPYNWRKQHTPLPGMNGWQEEIETMKHNTSLLMPWHSHWVLGVPVPDALQWAYWYLYPWASAEVSRFLVSDLSTAAVHPNIRIMALNLNDEEVGSLVWVAWWCFSLIFDSCLDAAASEQGSFLPFPSNVQLLVDMQHR